MREQFEKLTKDFCALVKLPEPAQVIAGQAFDANGITCSLNYDDVLTGDHCFLFADCGPTSPTTPPALYHELLVRNFSNFSGSGVGFGISPKNGHLFYAEPIELAGATADQLLNTCLFAAQQAQELHQKFPAAAVKK
ncbi:CesT family type III secretion system chaperone [Hydrogenophaga sp. PBL-H3]|uniref:CesT family type III secretion system chaperone n=1 Tax=Hydrogenophaga sp. PBL-H3 TaxID=434010 RepID=UPI0013570EFC|nr:CesT family type III secretion system chaperone [Hydrogenophaga sp. PBL-H3]